MTYEYQNPDEKARLLAAARERTNVLRLKLGVAPKPPFEDLDDEDQR